MQSTPGNSSSAEAAPSPCLYEYSVVRFLPDVGRGEFINVGLVMMCKRRRWIRAAVHVDPRLMACFCPDADIDALTAQLASFSAIASGRFDSPIAALEPHERFRWLTAVRSACIATSRPHPGTTMSLDDTFERLFRDNVLR